MYRISLTYFIAIVFILAGLNACQPEPEVPDQSKIYTSYLLNYNRTEDKTTAKATFYLNEPSQTNQQKLELTHPATVNYNNEELIFNSLDRVYKKEFLGLVQGSFNYKNYNGANYLNSISMVDSVDIYSSTDSVSMQSDYYFEVIGNPLASDEVVNVYVESINSGESYTSSFQSISGLTVQVSSAQLTSLGAGETLIIVNRRLEYTNNINTPDAGGLVAVEYTVQYTVVIY
ncbi:MAG: hypothetical protein HUJ25_03035 [Crocinitomicaceae bacterium]|nr:hypothetical protein [Crocinitomicaceae bacterium]